LNALSHVRVEHNHYSVPEGHLGRSVAARLGERMVEVFLERGGERIAVHRRLSGRNQYATHSNHMPERLKAVRDIRRPDYGDLLLARARRIGRNALPELVYDIGAVHTVRASNRFRVTFDTNRYSVPAEYASQRLTLKSYPDRLCIYHHHRLLARHLRSYERHRDFEHPDHPRALLEQRRKASTQRLLQRFVSLTARADEYYRELEQRRLNPIHHVRKIVALSETYGTEATARALDDAFEYGAFSSDYITNLLEARARMPPEPSALHLTRRSDLLELELPQPDLSLYDLPGDPTDDTP